MATKSTEKTKKNENIFSCDFCHFNTCKKTDYNRHLLTIKHKSNTLATADNTKNEIIYTCDCCNKKFKDRSGLWRHKKKCFANVDSEYKPSEPTEKELILMLIKQNTQLIEQNASLVKNGVNNSYSHNNNNNNSNNKTFNLQVFLNETCKDAMNITDFVNSIQLQLSDLEKVSEIGYTQGISNIIINNLNELDVTQRPVHCADKKREVIYIKDEDKWEKDNEDKMKMRKAIRRVADKNSDLLKKFQELHPDCMQYHSKYGDKYNKMMYEAYGGKGDNYTEKENKIIRNIAKNVVIDKEQST